MIETPVRESLRLKDRLDAICTEMIEKGILFSEAVGQFEKCFILETARRNNGNLSRTAGQLGIHRNTLAARLNQYKCRR